MLEAQNILRNFCREMAGLIGYLWGFGKTYLRVVLVVNRVSPALFVSPGLALFVRMLLPPAFCGTLA